MKKDEQDNRGFTLIELLLSIVLLAILILPALYGFISSAKINKKANDTQVATDMAQNIMETVKNQSIEDIAIQLYGKGSLSLLNHNYEIDSYVDGGYGEYIYSLTDHVFTRVTAADSLASVKITADDDSFNYKFQPPADRNTFYFGLNYVKTGGCTYDAVITMDASEYSKAEYNNSMNNYKMPRLIDLDQNAVGVIDLEGLTTTWSDESETAYITNKDSKDEQAINDFININLSYIAKLKSQPVPEGTTPTYPDPVKRASIIDNIDKKIIINLVKDTIQNKILVKCSLMYSCKLDLNGDHSGETLPMEIISGTFPIPEKETVEGSVYLFYTPSIFPDTIEIENIGSISNVYIVNQNAVPKKPVVIEKNESLGSITKILTNLTDGQRTSSSVINNDIYEFEDAKNRIYNITVTIYPAGTIESGNLGNELVTLTSTGEE